MGIPDFNEFNTSLRKSLLIVWTMNETSERAIGGDFTTDLPTRYYGNVSLADDQKPLLMQALIGIYIVFGFVIGLANILTIIAIVRCPELKTITNMFVLSLSCADLLLSPTLIMIHFLEETSHVVGIKGARVIGSLLLSLMCTSSATSILSILAIAVDRYFAVLHPYNYRHIMTRPRATLVIAAVWLYCSIFMFSLVAYYVGHTSSRVLLKLPLLSVIVPTPVYMGAIVSQIVICIIASVALYVRIFLAIRRRHKMSAALRGRNPNLETVESRRITQTMALVLGALIASWMPYAVVSIVTTERLLHKYHWFTYVDTVAILLLYANSFMNPVIYAARSASFRRAYWRMVCCSCGVMYGSPMAFRGLDTPTSGSTKSAKETLTFEINNVNNQECPLNG